MTPLNCPCEGENIEISSQIKAQLTSNHKRQYQREVEDMTMGSFILDEIGRLGARTDRL